ncbi:MAG: ATP-dependent RecD-like DNA helicase [Planctomycetota bacterium]|jgi:exodeoxyribonuclease V alpha subunit|nr:ATP-dependent RecD-like DNA helicase [Planctomycetota bacterium]
MTSHSDSGPKKGHEALEGLVDSVIFAAEDTGFAVVALSTGDGPVTAAGDLQPIHEGAHLRLHGKWQNHPRFGKQFRAEWSEHSSPTTKAGLERYLGSGAFFGIGPEMARRLVAHFGERTLEALEKGVAELRKVNGVGPKRAEALAENFQEGRDQHRVLAELRGLGLSGSQAKKAYDQWSAGAVERIRKDPWGLIGIIERVGFQTAESMATQIGLPKDCPERARGVILHFLREAAREGHVCLPQDQIWNQLESLGLATETVAGAVAELKSQGRLVLDDGPSPPPDSGNEKWWYLSGLWQDEVGLAENLHRLQGSGRALLATTAQVESALHRAAYPPDPSQLRAVKMALQEPVSVLTGGPGTGKTTTLRLLLEILDVAGCSTVRLASPTGRAAKRLQEATGRDASTLHRLLGFDPHEGGFRHDEDEPIEAEFVVVDEVSMMDINLAHSLVRALPTNCRLLLVGDADQLPSVGPGSVLRDLVASNAIPATRLELVHRQAAGSGITTAAHDILEGNAPETMTGTGGDFFTTYREDPEEAAAMVERVVCERIPEKYGLDPRRDILVLSPMYKGPLGVDALNERLGARLNPTQGDEDSIAANGLRVGDKVMVVRNDYDREVFNGDTGRVVQTRDGGVVVEMEGKLLEYEVEDLPNLIRSWCVTVHRSQGSEAPAVVVVLGNSHWIMLRRNLLYTGITRGKKLVTVIASRQALRRAIGNDDENSRFCLLQNRL